MKRIMIAAGLLLMLGSCYNDKYDKLYPVASTTCDTTSISYTNDVAPIITAYCAISGGCHNASGDVATGGLDYTVFPILQSQATTDLIVADINGTPGRGHSAMPLNLPKLSQCNINKITRWINEGAPDN
jgi:hypothetical protein